jgi:SAM-dependent methyltransferase
MQGRSAKANGMPRAWHDQWNDVDASPDPEWFARQLAGRADALLADAARTGPVFAALLGVGLGARVLEVGCGLGDVVALLAPRVGAAGLMGVDRSEVMLRLARERHPALRFERAEATRLPFEDAAFDAVFANLVLEHVSDPREVVAEMKRVTRPGGRLLVRETDWSSLRVESADPRIASIVIAQFVEAIAHPSVARELVSILEERGLIEVGGQAAQQGGGGAEPLEIRAILEEARERAVSAGLLDALDADRWWDDLRGRGLVATRTTCMAWGTVPSRKESRPGPGK